jgi:hypothetical protein
MLRDGGQKVGGGKDLEIPVDLGIEPGVMGESPGITLRLLGGSWDRLQPPPGLIL